MAEITTGGQLKLANGQTVAPQQGGWYDGRQFWSGKLGDPNTIINPEDKKAGQKVDSETMKAGSLIQSGGKDPLLLQKYFDNYAANIAKQLKGQDLSGSGAAGTIGSAVNDKSGRPTPPSMETEFQTLSGQYGVNDLGKKLNDLNAKKAKIQQSVSDAQGDTEAQPGVTADVVAGRESEQQRQANKQIAAVDLEIQATSAQLNTATNTIQMIMGFMQTDYTNAASAYDTEFTQNMQVYEAQTARITKAQSIASANWQTGLNLLTSSGKNWSDLSPAQKSFLNNQAIQAGIDPSLNELIHSNYAAGVTESDLKLASSAPTKKVVQAAGSFPVLGKILQPEQDQWQIYNPLTKQHEQFDNREDAMNAQSNYLNESVRPSGSGTAVTFTPQDTSTYDSIMGGGK